MRSEKLRDKKIVAKIWRQKFQDKNVPTKNPCGGGQVYWGWGLNALPCLVAPTAWLIFNVPIYSVNQRYSFWQLLFYHLEFPLSNCNAIMGKVIIRQ